MTLKAFKHMPLTRIAVMVLIGLNIVLFMLFVFIQRKKLETYMNPTLPTHERATFFFKDTVTVNSNDPHFQYLARQKLIDNFSIKTKAEIHVCLSDACTDTFTVPMGATNTNGILTDRSKFMFILKQTEDDTTESATSATSAASEAIAIAETASLTEYFVDANIIPSQASLSPASNNFATISFQITVTALVPLNENLTLSKIKDIIRNGTCKVWFDESQYVRDTFKIESGPSNNPQAFQFKSWSMNMTDPEIECSASECDAFRIVPR